MGYGEYIAIINLSAIMLLAMLAMLLLAATKFRGENGYAAAIIVCTTIPTYLYNMCRSEEWYALASGFAPVSFSVNTMLMPLLWLFVQRNFNPGFRFTLRQSLHFLPTVCALTLYVTYTLSIPAAERFDMMIYENTGDDTWLGDINSAIVFTQMFVYFTAISVYLHRVRKLVGDSLSEAEWLYKLWIRKFIRLILVLFLVVFVCYMLWPRTDVWLPQILNVAAMCYLVYHSLGSVHSPQVMMPSFERTNPKADKGGDVSDNTEQLRQYAETMLDYLRTTEAYTNPNLTLHDISSATNISYNNLSRAINVVLGRNFFETINRMRIEKAKSLLPTYKQNNLTLESLAEQCGFNSRIIFSNAFKRCAGMTTSQWLQSINREQNDTERR